MGKMRLSLKDGLFFMYINWENETVVYYNIEVSFKAGFTIWN